MSLLGASLENCHLTITAPSLGSLGTGAYTVASLVKPNAFSSSINVWRAYQANDFSYRGLFVDGDMWLPNEVADTNIPTFGNPALWYWMVVSKAAVDEAPRAHYAPYASSGSMTWVHVDSGTTQIARSSINRVCLGDEFGTQFKGNIACLAGFESEMTDAAIESLFQRSSANIMAALPDFFVHWPEAAGISSPFADLGGGGVETIRTGNWATSADPPSFDFSLVVARSGKAKVWNGSAWVAHPVKSFSGGSWTTHKISGYDGTQWVTSK